MSNNQPVTGGPIAAATTGFFAALKDQPLVLAMVVMNFSLIGLSYYQATLFNAQRADNVKLFVETQREVQKILSQCVVPRSNTVKSPLFKNTDPAVLELK